MLASKTDRVPTGAEWLHEVKWDGVRVLVDVRDGVARMTSRNDNNVTAAWPELSAPPLGDRDLMVDGEVIALNERGLPDFRVLQHRMHLRNAKEVARLVKSVPATLMVFDLLRLDGEDLTGRPLEERRALLEELPLADSTWQVPAAYDDGDMLFDATLAQGLEGVVSKRRASRYRFDQRSEDWRKLAHRHRGSFVVGGWRPQVGTANRLASLLVGEQTADGLLYRGRVGSGIAGLTSTRLADLLAPLASDTNPFADEVPRVDADGTFWVEPRVVVDIDTHGLGYERLRQPSFQGVRDDLTPEDLPMSRRQRGAGRRRGPDPDDQQPRQGALPAHRHDQGRGAQLLRAGLAGAAAAPARTARSPGSAGPTAWRRELLREEQAGRHAVVGAYGAVPTTGSRSGKGDGTIALPDLRRPRHAHLAGQPRRPRAPRPPVDGRARTARPATPTAWSSTSTPASPPACTSARRWR